MRHILMSPIIPAEKVYFSAPYYSKALKDMLNHQPQKQDLKWIAVSWSKKVFEVTELGCYEVTAPFKAAFGIKMGKPPVPTTYQPQYQPHLTHGSDLH